MKLIVGLGNPGKKYTQTRHNIGFMALDSLAQEEQAEFKRKIRFKSLVTELRLASEKLVLVKPQTYMNLSGYAVRSVLKSKGLTPQDLLVVVDDVDLKLGQVRLRERGSSGGHNGLKSISELLQTDDFPRLRLGVCGEKKEQDTADYVLSNFLSSEVETVNEVRDLFKELVHCLIEQGLPQTMNRFNKKI